MGIWEITEEEDFFLSYVPISRSVTHPHKRLQHLAGRYLLQHMFPDFPLSEIQIADTKKPFLEKEEYHFSISHCGNYAAAIASRNNRVGIDIEMVSPKIERVQHKFLGEAEHLIAVKSNEALRLILPELEDQLLTVLWSGKESVFKWYGLGKVDFKKNMQLRGEITLIKNEWLHLPFVFDKGDPIQLDLYARPFGQLVLSWVTTSKDIIAL